MRGILFLLFILLSLSAFSQVTENELYITANGNLYVPIQNPGKGTFPVLWYDKTTKPKVLVGGLGIGVSAFRPYKEKLHFKGAINLSRYTYWDESFSLTDENARPIGIYGASTSDFCFGLTLIYQYALTPKLFMGGGLGTQIMLASVSPGPDISGLEPTAFLNRYYKKIMPAIPIEISYKTQKNLLSLRYEQGLLNRYKKGLSEFKKDKFGVLFFETGFKLH